MEFFVGVKGVDDVLAGLWSRVLVLGEEVIFLPTRTVCIVEFPQVQLDKVVDVPVVVHVRCFCSCRLSTRGSSSSWTRLSTCPLLSTSGVFAVAGHRRGCRPVIGQGCRRARCCPRQVFLQLLVIDEGVVQLLDKVVDVPVAVHVRCFCSCRLSTSGVAVHVRCRFRR